jgi:bifunctional ADP-heptose synthase (sugar kinase/adenylyltransferase)
MMLPRILVVGEALWDHNHIGEASRLSPEAPIPVVSITSETFTAGGAYKVEKTLQALGAETSHLFQKGWGSPDGKTSPVKNRLFVGDTCVARWDEQDRCEPLDLESLPLGGFDAVVISDYGKGGFPPEVRNTLMGKLALAGLPTFIDTKESPWAWGSSATFFPNAREYRAHERAYSETSRVVRTLGEAGMEYLERGQCLAFEFPQNLHPRTVIGAGDVVIAAFAFASAQGRNHREALRFAAEQVGLALTSPYGASL